MEEGARQAYLSRLAEDGRLHRPGLLPAVGKATVDKLLAAHPLALSCETLTAELAQSGDFGWTLGRYEWRDAQGQRSEHGHYVRV